MGMTSRSVCLHGSRVACASARKDRLSQRGCACRKTAIEMGEPYASKLELVSFHTVSKGVYGECGLRGGYFDAMNIHPDAVAGARSLLPVP